MCSTISPFTGEDGAKLMACLDESNPRIFLLMDNQEQSISLLLFA